MPTAWMEKAITDPHHDQPTPGASPPLTEGATPADAPDAAPAADGTLGARSSQPPLSERPAGQAERSLELALAAAEVARDNRGEDIRVLDLREVTPEFDYFVVATGKTRRQLHAISEEIDHRLEDGLGDRRMGIEGYDASRWILLDYGSVVVHLFDEEMRGYYSIEDLWNDAQETPLPWDESPAE